MLFLYSYLARCLEAQGEAKASEDSISKYHTVTWGFKLQSFPKTSTSLFPYSFKWITCPKTCMKKEKVENDNEGHFEEDHPM